MSAFRQQVIAIGIPPLAGMLLIGLALGPTLNAVGALGEEIGWRGFLYKELAPLGFWRCSLLPAGCGPFGTSQSSSRGMATADIPSPAGWA
jgi:membrane protease YdiL (CAAX protease family)